VDLNGIVLLSAILNFDNSADGPRWNPGIDQPYVLALPTYAATAFYHRKLSSQPPSLEKFLQEVEQFATGDYAAALLAGAQLSESKQREIAGKLHNFTGLPMDYILKANLRIEGGAFSKMLQDAEGVTTGRLDTRFRGPDLNRLSEEAEYDPQASAISAAYTAAINDYMRTELKFGKEETYKPNIYEDIGTQWDYRHTAPGGPPANQGGGMATNTMPDLAFALKSNPRLRVLLAGGYYDLATPYFEGIYEMRHLPVPRSLLENISYKYYQSGHMVYLNDNMARQFKADLAQFVRDTESGK
jgi:carboxypeptidase C (cathepsin A)